LISWALGSSVYRHDWGSVAWKFENQWSKLFIYRWSAATRQVPPLAVRSLPLSLRHWLTAVGCGGELTTPSGQLMSPNYPRAYPHQRECRWYVTVEPGKRINISIVDFDMEAHENCGYDMLAVSISQTTTIACLLAAQHLRPSGLFSWRPYGLELSRILSGTWRSVQTVLDVY